RSSMRSPTRACNSGLSSSDRTYLRVRSRRRRRCAPSTRPRLRSGGRSSRRQTSRRNKADWSPALKRRTAMKLTRRIVLQLAAAGCRASRRATTAQADPPRPGPVSVFVPAGGTPDIIARLLGQSLSQRLGQSVVIDNRPGGGGNLALQAVARAPADGYSLLLVATPHAINVTLYEKSPVTVTRDIVPVASLNSDSFVLLVNPSFPAKTVAEFIAQAKANP